ncbi:glycosyl hydrolase 43 family protein [Empedobacter falsenii]|uniref:glycoside hydrolase family 43 protein n=1 Tax=Empedobacter falsenii TaxID=343874 RepID=UPI00257552F9|nr:glycoside hydrolase 43 family protein [Empedobacter falsenii]MDM1298422.1 glycosyl hydrolase 43 family protein [Empedobacter falsenii]MDM1318021.1 glycosyl hydrolase 43 family protein [Empedobacter falsenii]
MKSTLILLSFLGLNFLPIHAQKSNVWVSDLGNGTYKNPVLYADYSDPDAIRVGDDFFMTASSFNEAPGLPILHSTDMINWKLVNHALPDVFPIKHFSTPKRGDGVWAPSIRFHNNEYYIYWGDPDFGIYMVKTKNPFGKWEEPVLVEEGKGIIDTCPFWDEDGNAYIVHGWAGSRAGVKSLLTIKKMNAEGTKVLDKGKHIFDGHENHPTVEGPKVYKRNGYYYIFAPAGGVATGWQLVLRSKNIYGPYDEKIVLEQGKSTVNGPHQGAWVDTKNGEDWFYHFQDADTYGRIVHLQPMKWINDWPFIGVDQDKNGIGEPVLTYKKPTISNKSEIINPSETDEFKGNDIGLQWQWSANPSIVWYSKLANQNFLRLFSIKVPENSNNLWTVPNLLTQKFPAPNFTASTKVKLTPEDATEGKTAGLLIMGTDYQSLVITNKKDGYYLQLIRAEKAEKNNPEKILSEVKLGSNEVFLKIKVSEPNGICQFSFSENGKKYTSIGEPFQAKPGKWIGAKVGIYSISSQDSKRGGYADFDWFRIDKNEK